MPTDNIKKGGRRYVSNEEWELQKKLQKEKDRKKIDAILANSTLVTYSTPKPKAAFGRQFLHGNKNQQQGLHKLQAVL